MKFSLNANSTYEKHTISGDSLSDVVSKWCEYRDNEGLGNSDLTKNTGVISFDGKPHVYMSFNGRLWNINDRKTPFNQS